MTEEIEHPAGYAASWPVQPARVRKYALGVLRDAKAFDENQKRVPEDRRRYAAQVLADHLRFEFEYSLNNPAIRGEDPVIDFLFNQREGHCELFASAHAAMCRSLGIPARVITGFRASEYNSIGEYFVVRQNHAHAWTEVYCGPAEGWYTFDTTPPDRVNQEHAREGHWFSGLRSLYDHLEYSWLRTVVAYDRHTRAAVLADMSEAIESRAGSERTLLGKAVAWVRDLPSTWRLDKIGYTAAGIVMVMLGIAIASLARLIILRRRKLAALQLTAVPRARRRGMTRKLRFYLRMLEMLERHGYTRQAWQSPFQFATELSTQHPGKFDAVIALTEVFYEVRFGHRDLDDARRTLVKTQLKALERAFVTVRV